MTSTTATAPRITIGCVNAPRKRHLLAPRDQAAAIGALARDHGASAMALQEVAGGLRRTLGKRALSATANSTLRDGNTIGNSVMLTGDTQVIARSEIALPWGARTLHLPVVLLRTPEGATLAVVSVHLPTRRSISEHGWRRMVRAIRRYTNGIEGAVALAGDWNRGRQEVGHALGERWTCAGQHNIDGIWVRDAKPMHADVVAQGVKGRISDHPVAVMATMRLTATTHATRLPGGKRKRVKQRALTHSVHPAPTKVRNAPAREPKPKVKAKVPQVPTVAAAKTSAEPMPLTARVVQRLRREYNADVLTHAEWGSQHRALYAARRTATARGAYGSFRVTADTIVQHITVTTPSGDFARDCRLVESIGIARFASGVSYNWLVDMQTGQIAVGQPLDAKGTHTVNDKGIAGYSHNQNLVARAIAVVGQPGTKLSPAAARAIASILAAMADEDASTPDPDYVPHSLFAYKDCPCESTRSQMPTIKALARRLRSGKGAKPSKPKPTPTPAPPPEPEPAKQALPRVKDVMIAARAHEDTHGDLVATLMRVQQESPLPGVQRQAGLWLDLLDENRVLMRRANRGPRMFMRELLAKASTPKEKP